MKRLKRLVNSAIFSILRGESKARYVNKRSFFKQYGSSVVFQPHLIPLYPELIAIHDNVVVGRNVEFVTHDMAHRVYRSSGVVKGCFKERIGCIEIEENVFIGNGAIVLYGVKIARNCIIAAGSVVTKDTEENGVYAGVPARRIGEFSSLAAKTARQIECGVLSTTTHNQNLTPDEVAFAWQTFYSTHGEKGSDE